MDIKRSKNNVFLFIVIVLFHLDPLIGPLFVSQARAGEVKEWGISSNEAFEIFDKIPEIKMIERKNFKAGLSTSTGLLASPVTAEPFYVFFSDTMQCISTRPGACETKTIERLLFYIDAEAGTVLPQQEAEAFIEGLRQAEVARSQSEADALEQEKVFQTKLEKAWQAFEAKKFGGDADLLPIVAENKSVFLKALTCLTPDIRERGARILGDVARMCAGCKGAVHEAVPLLVDLLQDSDDGIRITAAVALESLAGKGDADVITALRSLLKDGDGVVRRTAIHGLSILGDAQLTPVYIGSLNDPWTAEAAVSALAKTGDGRAVEPLKELFHDARFAGLQPSIIAALGDMRDPAAVPFLVELLNKEYARKPVRWRMAGGDAAQALADIGQAAVLSIHAAMGSPERLTRLYAVWAATLMKAPELRPALGDALALEKDPLIHVYLQRAIALYDGLPFKPAVFDSLELSVQPEKQRFTQDDPINFYWILKNTGHEPVIFNAVPVGVVQPAFMVKPLDGQSSGFWVDIDWHPFPDAEALVTIAPGESYRAGPFDLKEYFDLVLPGNYEIRGAYNNRYPGIEYGVYAVEGSLQSDAVKIYVLQK